MLWKLLARRMIALVPTVLALTLLVFAMVKAVPGDAALIALGERASPEALAATRHEMGLDRPWYIQYGRYVFQMLVEQDLGTSLRSHQPISEVIAEKFPATIELALAAMLLATAFGIPLGILAAIRPGGLFDVGAMTLAVFGVSMPVFWLGLLLMWVFGVVMGILPLSGRQSFDVFVEPFTGFLLFDALWALDMPAAWDALKHLLLPAMTLASIPTAILARMTRSSMVEALALDCCRTARAKGLGPMGIALKHGLRNAALPIVTVVGLQLGTLLGGAVITETVFAWPGLGRWLLESVSARDYDAIQGGILVVAMSFVVINFAIDALYLWIDPRVRAASSPGSAS